MPSYTVTELDAHISGLRQQIDAVGQRLLAQSAEAQRLLGQLEVYKEWRDQLDAPADKEE